MIYRHKLPRRIARLLERSPESRGRFSDGTKYSIPYTMQSGWPDTSCGDTLANAAMKFYIHGINRKWFSIICGDDSVTVTTNKEIERIGGLEKIIEQYAEMGMEVEATLTRNPLDVGFCSGRFLPTFGTYVLVPKIGKLLSKLGWDSVDRSPKHQKEWLRGIAETLLNFGQLDPLALTLGMRIRRLVGEGKVIREEAWEYKVNIKEQHSIDWSSYYEYMEHHYHLSTGDIGVMCAQLSNVVIGEMLCDPRFTHIAEIDV
jgi:hypothetical protein